MQSHQQPAGVWRMHSEKSTYSIVPSEENDHKTFSLLSFYKEFINGKKNLSCFSHFFFLLNYYSFHWLSFLYCLSRQMKIPNKCIFTMKVSRYLDYDCEVSQIFKSAQLSMLPLWTVRAVLHWKAQSTQWVPQIWEHQHKAGWIVWECALEKTHEIGFTLVF